MKAPCKDCPDRFVGCHSQCEKYIAFQKYREEYLEYRHKQNHLKDDLWKTSRYSKMKKKRRYYHENSGG